MPARGAAGPYACVAHRRALVWALQRGDAVGMRGEGEDAGAAGA